MIVSCDVFLNLNKSCDLLFDENNFLICNLNLVILDPLALDRNNQDTFSSDNNDRKSKYEHIANDIIS